MKNTTRVWLLCLLLALLIGVQTLYLHYLDAALAVDAATALAAPLAAVPLRLGDWRGEDISIDDPKLLYADQHVQRLYTNEKLGGAVKLWMAYSATGEDRKHHPEVCMAVAGQPEDASARQTLDVAGHDAPIQRYRFGRRGDQRLIFYWHYTLPKDGSESLDALQAFYRRLHRRPASVTIEVFATDQTEEDALSAADFVRRLDQSLQAIVGPDAVRGSRRLPVTILPQ